MRRCVICQQSVEGVSHDNLVEIPDEQAGMVHQVHKQCLQTFNNEVEVGMQAVERQQHNIKGEAPIQKGGGEVRVVRKARDNRHKPNWVQIVVDGHITWADANV